MNPGRVDDELTGGLSRHLQKRAPSRVVPARFQRSGTKPGGCAARATLVPWGPVRSRDPPGRAGRGTQCFSRPAATERQMRKTALALAAVALLAGCLGPAGGGLGREAWRER